MKILHISPFYYPSLGGTEFTIKILSERLEKLGHEVVVFTSNTPCVEALWNPEIPLLPAGSEWLNGVEVRRFHFKRFSFTRKALRVANYPLNLMGIPAAQDIDIFTRQPFAPSMVREILRFQPDIMLAAPFSFSNSVVYYAYLAKKLMKIPLIYHTAIHVEHQERLPSIIYRIMSHADGVWTSTEYEKEFLVKKGIPSERIHTIGIGVDPSAFEGAEGRIVREKYGLGNSPVVLFLGRKDEQKGMMTIIDAMQIVREQLPEAKLVLAGTPTLFSRTVLKDRITKIKNNYVVLVDEVSEVEKKHFFDACDVFVMPSRVESFGIVYLEAWSCKKPVIGADIGAVRCVITDGEDGFLVEYGNARQLAKRVIRLLENPELRQKLGNQGWQKVHQNYTWDIVTEKVREIYHKLCRSA